MKQKTKKIFFPGAALIISYYISAVLAIGLLIGYFSTNFFVKKYIYTGRINSIILNLGEWKIHFHHWILGSLALFVAYSTGLSFFWLGILSGLVFQDIYADKRGWYKVIYKKKN